MPDPIGALLTGAGLYDEIPDVRRRHTTHSRTVDMVGNIDFIGLGVNNLYLFSRLNLLPTAIGFAATATWAALGELVTMS